MTVLLAQTRPFPDWEWLGRNTDLITRQFVEHVQLTGLAVLLGFVIAFPLAILALRWRAAYQPLLQTTGVLFTIPSLALFALLVPFTGLSTTTALIGLVIYTLLILFRNIVTALDGVPDEVLESAEAMGYRRARRLVAVELPLALPVIVAGIRIATVTTIGLVTITALIGQGGLGQLFLQGFRRSNLTAEVAGFVLSIGLAVAADLSLVATQRALSPWTRGR